jgi:hypothetical protein
MATASLTPLWISEIRKGEQTMAAEATQEAWGLAPMAMARRRLVQEASSTLPRISRFQATTTPSTGTRGAASVAPTGSMYHSRPPLGAISRSVA